MLETVIVILIVLAAFTGVVYWMRKKLSRKDGCCGCKSKNCKPEE
ncbi:MAG TPA: FeoB-associated Cys-rich membrane protein [Phycisphaerae bacterium]|nr:FeoB-associated Cys-rich membrane protein [Phycisphaerae bacterium]